MKKIGTNTKAPRRAEDARARLTKLARELPASEWNQAASRLKRAILKEASPPAAALSHSEAEEALDLYVSDAQRGRDVRKLYPALWNHLQTCSLCAESAKLLSEMQGTETMSAGIPVRSEASLPAFLEPQMGLVWQRQPVSELLPARPGVGFLLNPRRVQRWMSFAAPTAAPSVRDAEGTPEAKLLLLDESVELQGRTLAIQTWLIRADEPRGSYHIHLWVSSPEDSESDFRAGLRWGGRDYEAELHEGEADFQDVDPIDVQGTFPDAPSPEFRLTLEALSDETGPTD